jgi:hypothetical protein
MNLAKFMYNTRSMSEAGRLNHFLSNCNSHITYKDLIQSNDTDTTFSRPNSEAEPIRDKYLMKHLLLFEAFNRNDWDGPVRSTAVFYHGSADKNLIGKNGIHVGSHKAAKQALNARIGIPADGAEWDGTREYGKTLLAGKKTLESKDFKKKIDEEYPECGFNCSAPEEDYYPGDREKKATYSDHSEVPMSSKPIIFPVRIVGKMSNSQQNPHGDNMANGLMSRSLKSGKAKSGFYYVNIGEDSGSVSAVVPDKTFLQLL